MRASAVTHRPYWHKGESKKNGYEEHVPRVLYTCFKCLLSFDTYETLVEHLYWCHGTESHNCPKCPLKMWTFAEHECFVVPQCKEVFDQEPASEPESELEPYRESEYCLCGRNIEGASMIACDSESCKYEWYHYTCVGIVEAPDGDWICPYCR